MQQQELVFGFLPAPVLQNITELGNWKVRAAVCSCLGPQTHRDRPIFPVTHPAGVELTWMWCHLKAGLAEWQNSVLTHAADPIECH